MGEVFNDPDPRVRTIGGVASSSVAAHVAATDPHGDRAAATTALSAHLTDASAAHAASAVSYNPATSGLSATDVQAAIDAVVALGVGGGSGDMTKAVYDPNTDGVIAIAQGGTGAITAGAARTALGLAAVAASGAAADVSGLATVATSGSAADLGTGALPAGRMPALTGDVTSAAGAVATTIAAAAVTLPKMANLAANSLIGNNTGSAVTPIALTTAQVKALLAIVAGDVSGLATVATSGSAADLGSGALPAGRMPALTGDVTTSAGAVATAIGAHKVTRGMQAQGGARTLVGVVGASTADVADIALNFLAVTAAVADVSITGTASPTSFGQLHRCTGTSAGYTITLPVCSGNAGQMMGFVMDRALTVLVTLVLQSTDVIGESLTTLSLWAGESIVLRVNAAGDGYDIVEWRRRPMRARFTDPGALSFTGSSTTIPNFAALDYDIGGLGSTTNDYFTIKRAGIYHATGTIRFTTGATATRFSVALNWYPSSHTGGVVISDAEIDIDNTATFPGLCVSGCRSYAIGEICELSVFFNGTTRNSNSVTFDIREVF